MSPFAIVETPADIHRLSLHFPLFAKPAAEGTGKGIDAASRIGDRAAFAELVARHHVSLFRLFRRLGLDEHAAEDCVQDTFMRVLSAAPSYRPTAPFRAFLRRLARNALVDWTRRRKDAAMTLRDPRDPALIERPDRAQESPLDVRACTLEVPCTREARIGANLCAVLTSSPACSR